MHDDPVIVASLHTFDCEDQFYIDVELRLAKIGKHFLLGRYDEQWENDYAWTDSDLTVKKAMQELFDEACTDEGTKSWQDKKLVDSIKDSSPLFGIGWSSDDIVREIESDENFGIRILSPDEEIPEEYYE